MKEIKVFFLLLSLVLFSPLAQAVMNEQRSDREHFQPQRTFAFSQNNLDFFREQGGASTYSAFDRHPYSKLAVFSAEVKETNRSPILYISNLKMDPQLTHDDILAAIRSDIFAALHEKYPTHRITELHSNPERVVILYKPK